MKLISLLNKGKENHVMASNAKKQVAVVIPFRNRNYFTPSEEISLRHLDTYLSNYDRYILVPKGLKLEREGYFIKHFPRKYFGSVKANEKSDVSKFLYENFQDYDYILIHHLDSLVFSDQLSYWCELGYDYIGAPWVIRDDKPNRIKEGVGNGGFCLRRVNSFLKVLNSKQKWVTQDEIRKYYYSKHGRRYRIRNFLKLPLLSFPWNNTITRHLKLYLSFSMRTDAFWEKYAKYYYSDFKIAPVDVALRFAFESAPRHCFERTGRVLPFGCHAWERFDKEFWMPYILNGEMEKQEITD
jgi:hypothetical protein